jgi:hypothetical protein
VLVETWKRKREASAKSRQTADERDHRSVPAMKPPPKRNGYIPESDHQENPC